MSKKNDVVDINKAKEKNQQKSINMEDLRADETIMQTTPIKIDELQLLKFENAKLKIDILNNQLENVKKSINDISKNLNDDILQYMEKTKIPSHYRLDFQTMTFIVPKS